MKKHLLSLATLLVVSAAAYGQKVYPLLKVSDIQFVSPDTLAACKDRPSHVGDTVRVRGIVIAPGNQAQVGVTSPSVPPTQIQTWIRDISSDGPFNNITVFYSGNPSTPTNLYTSVPGDTLEITGVVIEFDGTGKQGETEIAPLADGVRNIGDNTGPAPTAHLVDNVGIFSDDKRLNNITTGEQWEGGFVEIQNVTVEAVNPFSNNTRLSFTVKDAAGNQIEIYDRCLAARQAGAVIPGTFIAPNVGDQFTSIKGVIVHQKNRCPGTGTTNRGYLLNPFDASHYKKGSSSPVIGGITRNPSQPCFTSATTVQATIKDDGTIATATLFYAIGETGTYKTVAMTKNSDTTYTAPIPAQPNDTFVKYYFSATDNQNNTTVQPNPTKTPLFFISRCGGPTIRDLQYTPYPDGNSGYVSQAVANVSGVVAASSKDLGSVFLQQPNQGAWGGIWVYGSSALTDLNIGDQVTIAGNVEENFGMTRIKVTDAVTKATNQNVTALALDPSVIAAYDFAANEQYESVLVKAIPTNNAALFVIDSNLPSTTGRNVGQYRLGTDVLNPTAGVVVQAGNQSTNNYSSLNVSYVNNPFWGRKLASGVAPYVVTLGEKLANSVTGIMYYGFNVLFMLPRTSIDVDYITGINPQLSKGQHYTLAGVPAHAGHNLLLMAKEGAMPAKGLTLDLVDSKGAHLVLSKSTQSESSLTIQLPTVAPGLYTVRITDNLSGKIEAHRLVIQ